MKSCNVILDLTEDCMLRCSYCYINGGESHLKMNAETAINTVKKFAKSYKDGIVYLLFHGGEPLLVFDRIQEIVNYINDEDIRNIKLYIQTNAIEVDENIARYLFESNIKTCVSIDGFTPEANACRRSENEDVYTITGRILKGMDYLINAGHKLSTICVLNKKNINFINQYIEESAERGIFLVSMNPIINLGRSIQHEELLLENEEISQGYISIIQKINTLIEKGHEIIERNSLYYYRRFISEKPEYMCMNTPCGAGTCVFVIKCNGDIFPCSDFSFNPDLKLGNVNSEILFSLENGQPRRMLHELYTDSLEHNEKCAKCRWKKKCSSGCSARKYLATGKIGGALDPLCSVYEAINTFFASSDKNISHFTNSAGAKVI
ncbi:MAG: radical SAM protein [Bacteroidales bacterium]|jgi:uncharacterized protein|nr:radical SAM protein [Bacteroidales bacterium]